MFGNIFFIFILFIFITFIPDIPYLKLPFSFLGIVSLLFTLYFTTVAILYRLGFMLSQKKISFLPFIILFCFFFFSSYMVGIFQTLLTFFPFKLFYSFFAFFCLSLYFFGLWFFYMGEEIRKTDLKKASQKAFDRVRFLLPFSFPFLLLLAFFDLLAFLPFSLNPQIAIFFTALFLVILLIFMPVWTQKIWGCPLLEPEKTRKKLEETCNKVGFRHAGIKSWTPLNHAITAAILGIIPRFRYVLFTKKLVEELAEDEIEAVLLHEIGHSKYKHLWIYPFILAGMILLSMLINLVFSFDFFQKKIAFFLDKPLYLFSAPLIGFIFYALLFVLYFRFVFGFFSRLFERQADLHIFSSDINPETMANALHHLAVATGYTHKTPSWHHGSLENRIQFIHQAIKNPTLISAHHQKVKRCLFLYFFFFTLSALFIAFY